MECSLKCSYPALVPRPQIWLILFSEFCLWMLRERQSRFSWCTYFSCPHPQITPTWNPDFTPVSQRQRRLVCGNSEISISSVPIPKSLRHEILIFLQSAKKSSALSVVTQKFLYLLLPSPNFLKWFVGLEYTEPLVTVIYKNAPLSKSKLRMSSLGAGKRSIFVYYRGWGFVCSTASQNRIYIVKTSCYTKKDWRNFI